MKIIAPHTVLVEFSDLVKFQDERPADDFRFTNGHSISFVFSTGGDLLDCSWYDAAGGDCPEPRGVDPLAFSIVAMQAQNFLVSFLAGLEIAEDRPQLSLF